MSLEKVRKEYCKTGAPGNTNFGNDIICQKSLGMLLLHLCIILYHIFAHVTLLAVRGFGEYKLLSGLNMTILATSSFRNSTTETRIQEIINADPENSIMVISSVFHKMKVSNLLTNVGPRNVLCI